MAENFIRAKQINQSDLSGFVQNVIDSNEYEITYGGTGININNVAQINLSGVQLNLTDSPIISNLNVSGDLTVAGTIKYNEVIDITTTGNISGYTGYFQELYANNLVYNTGNQNIYGYKAFRNNGFDIVTSGETISISSGLMLRVPYGTDPFNKDFDINLLSYPYSNSYISMGYETGRVGKSINSANNFRELKIWETGGYITQWIYKMARFGPYGVILSEDSFSKVGIGTSFPTEKVHISGGNLKVEQTGIFNALDLNNIDNLNLSGVDVTIQSATVDLNNSTLINAMPQLVNETTNFIISGNDNGRVILANHSLPEITGTIVSGNPIGFNTSIIQINSGIFITGSGNGVTINSFGGYYRTAGRFATVSLLHTGNNGYIMYGNTI